LDRNHGDNQRIVSPRTWMKARRAGGQIRVDGTGARAVAKLLKVVGGALAVIPQTAAAAPVVGALGSSLDDLGAELGKNPRRL
jgi:hypothetical protein